METTDLLKKVRKIEIKTRGLSQNIFAGEYLTGSLLKRHNACPWDYSSSPYSVRGLIRLDYAPYWFGAGLIFEKILFPSLRKK